MRSAIGLVVRTFAVTTLWLLATAGSASAHALYERSDPASGGRLDAPGQVRIWFTEAIEPGFSKVEILDTSRKKGGPEEVRSVPGDPRSLIATVGALPDGTYTVSWQVLSAIDGHVTRGVFPLVVGTGGLSGTLEEAPAFVPSPGDVLVRWLSYLAALALAGGFLFRVAVLAPALARVGRARQRDGDLLGAHEAWFRRWGLAASVALLAAGLIGMALQAASAADVPLWEALGGPLWRLSGTRLGLLWEARLGLAALIALLLWRAPGRALWWGGVAAGAALLAVISLNSHAAAIATGAWLAVGLDWLHQVAAAAWVGGLFAFLPVILLARRLPEAASRTRVLAALVPRFSALAIAAVVVLALTGLFQTWLQVSSWSALDTPYGISLIVKLALIAPLLALGAANLLIARPRLTRAAAARRRGLRAGVPRLVRRFQWAVAAEALLGVGVLLATAVLAASEPARETHARRPRPIEFVGVAEDIGVAVRITPARPGANQFEVRLDGGDGRPPPDIQRVTLRFTYLDQDLGSGNLVLESREDGTYGAVSTIVSTDGNWQIETIVRQRGRDDVRVGSRVLVASAETAGQPPSLDALAAPDWLTPRRGMALGFMALGLALALWISRSRDVHRRERLALYAASVAVATIGGVLYTRAASAPAAPADIQALRSPFAPDSASLARGKQVYEQSCVSCHGVSGRGDGPVAPSLRPRPADFRAHMEAGHTDGELYNWLSKGVPGTAMPAFEGQLSEADRWHVINYIRGFAPQTQ